MRKVLLLSPHFVPSDIPDMQRLRVCVGHFRTFGWEPHVLCVDDQYIGRESDHLLEKTIPTDVAVTKVGALSGLPGVNAIGIRAFHSLGHAGARLLEKERFDLVFVSTTAFPVMYLARRWGKKYGVPYVLDFQDPWGVFPKEAGQFLRKNLKSRLVQKLHRVLEGLTVSEADGLVAVSHRYIETLQETYRVTSKSLVQPIPFSNRDFEVAGEVVGEVAGELNGQPNNEPNSELNKEPNKERQRSENDQTIRCVFLGRVPDAMRAQLELLMLLVKPKLNHSSAGMPSIRFIGTTYQAGEATNVSEMVQRYQLEDQIQETMRRISYLESLAEMKRADVLLLLGSSDTSYLPSKVTPYLASGRPILLLANAESQLYRQLAPCDGVLAIDASSPPGESFDLQKELTQLLQVSDYGPRGALEAEEATGELVGLFESVCRDEA